MRLFLSSYKLGDHGERFRELNVPNAKLGIITNAGDIYSESEIEQKVREDQDMFKPYGYTLSRLDLRQYFGRTDKLKETLSKLDGLWVRGGNTFVLRRAMRESGFDILIKPMLTEDRIVYAGYSAGAVVLQHSLRGLDLVDSPKEIPAGYPPEIVWEGLGLLDYNLAVHYRSDHPESAAVEKEVEYLKSNKKPYKTLKDGQVIVINGDKEEFLK